ncbi:MAG: homocysteine S-methyltransferase family protein [Candidatus Puniceispirillaceae bacterium]
MDEVNAALEAAAQTGVRLLLGVTVLDSDGSKLRSGEPLKNAVQRADESNIGALLANCSIASRSLVSVLSEIACSSLIAVRIS